MAIISTLVCTTAGYLYPVYKSYKIFMYNPSESSKILVYWIVIGTYTMCQIITDKILFWFPFYNEMKAVFVLWLALPQTNGYQLIFDKFISNFLNKYEKQIDSGYETVLYLLKNKLIEVSQKLWVLIQERIFSNDIKNRKPKDYVQEIEPPLTKTKLIEDTPQNFVSQAINNNNPIIKKVVPISSTTDSPIYQRKPIAMPNSPVINKCNDRVEHKAPVQRTNSNSNYNSNINTPIMKTYKKSPSNTNVNNNPHVSDRYQKIKLYKEQLLDVLSQLEKDEEKELKNYNKNSSKIHHQKSKSSISNSATTNVNNNNNNNMIYNKLHKNHKDDNNDFEYSLDKNDYEAILTDSKAFVKNNNRGHSSSITNFLKNLKSR